MRHNVGGTDRTIRMVLGVALIAVGALAPLDMVWRIALFALAAIALITGTVRYCPLNAALGINTCHTDHTEPPQQQHPQH